MAGSITLFESDIMLSVFEEGTEETSDDDATFAAFSDPADDGV